MEILFKKITDLGLSPNQFYLLYCLHKKTKAEIINISLELRALRSMKILDKSNSLTEYGMALIESFDEPSDKKLVKKTLTVDPQMVEAYRLKWPSGRLPSGIYARENIKNLEVAFKWFFANYSYDWDTIMKATDRYIDEYESQNFKFMRNSKYFIRKSEIDKSTSSDLANYCDHILSGAGSEKAGTYIFPEKVD